MEEDAAEESAIGEVRALAELEAQLRRSEQMREEGARRHAEVAAENAALLERLEASASERSLGVRQLAALARRLAEEQTKWDDERKALEDENGALRARVEELEGEEQDQAVQSLKAEVERLATELRVARKQLAVLSEAAFAGKAPPPSLAGGSPPSSPPPGKRDYFRELSAGRSPAVRSPSSITASIGSSAVGSTSKLVGSPAQLLLASTSARALSASSSVDDEAKEANASTAERRERRREEQARINRENREYAKRLAAAGSRTAAPGGKA